MEKTSQNPASELERLTWLKNRLGCRDQEYWTEHEWRKKMWEDEAARRIKADREDRLFEVGIHLAEKVMDRLYELAKPWTDSYSTREPGSQKSNDQPKNGKNEQ